MGVLILNWNYSHGFWIQKSGQVRASAHSTPSLQWQMHEEAAKQANLAGLSAWAGSEPFFYWGMKGFFTLSTNISGTIAIFIALIFKNLKCRTKRIIQSRMAGATALPSTKAGRWSVRVQTVLAYYEYSHFCHLWRQHKLCIKCFILLHQSANSIVRIPQTL